MKIGDLSIFAIVGWTLAIEFFLLPFTKSLTDLQFIGLLFGPMTAATGLSILVSRIK